MNKTAMAMLAALSWCVGGVAGSVELAADVELWFDFLTPAERQSLATGMVYSAPESKTTLGLVTRSPAAEVFRSLPELSKPTVVAEAVYLLPRPALNELALYNSLQALETMAGLTYWSATQKKREMLILESWRVTSADKKARSADPEFPAIPRRQKALVYQKDNRFGAGFTEVVWQSLPGGQLLLTLTNQSTLSFAFLPVVDPGALRMTFLLVPFEQSLALCARLEGRTLQVPGLSGTVDQSIRNRLDALADWLAARISSPSARSF